MNPRFMFTRHITRRAATLLCLSGLIAVVTGAEPPAPAAIAGLKTKHVVVLVIDGPRWTETWGRPGRDLIPVRDKTLAPQGVLLNDMSNDGPTYTKAGHSALTTGFHQEINNNGVEFPKNPSITQRLIAAGADPKKVWIVSSKDKLVILSDTTSLDWNNKSICSMDCGKNGGKSGYREDTVTLEKVKSVISTNHPTYLLINLRGPDTAGHAKDWEGYLASIKTTDQYAGEIWAQIQADPVMRDTTTLFITNDHGRHLDGHADGYISHGDNCAGCRKIELLAIGPDFKKGAVSDLHRNQTDVAVTAAQMLGISIPESQGKLMTELFSAAPLSK